METFFFFIASFILGVICSVILFSWILKRAMEQRLHLLEQALQDEIESVKVSPVVKLKVEQHNGIFYCYDADTDEFVCQGINFNDLFSSFKKRFPNKSGLIMQQYAHYFSNDPTAKDFTAIG